MNATRALLPGSVVGILGGGQLGRMTALAAARLGYRSHIYCPHSDSPASTVAHATTVAAWGDRTALDAFAGAVDVVTAEFENVSPAALAYLNGRCAVRPGPHIFEIAQCRIKEKTFLEGFVETAPWQAVSSLGDLRDGIKNLGLPAILKTTRFGYDGKGQIRINPGDNLSVLWNEFACSEAILEGVVAFERELSIIVARNAMGDMKYYPPVENIHKNHILDLTIAPALISDSLAQRAAAIAADAAARLDLVGLLAIELFVTCDEETQTEKLLANEMAPRPHNSGHWTQDGAVTDQFEQLTRVVCGLPLGDVSIRCPTVMKNLLGDAVACEWGRLLGLPNAKVHLYGKTESRANRKMGHVNFLNADATFLPNLAQGC